MLDRPLALRVDLTDKYNRRSLMVAAVAITVLLALSALSVTMMFQSDTNKQQEVARIVAELEHFANGMAETADRSLSTVDILLVEMTGGLSLLQDNGDFWQSWPENRGHTFLKNRKINTMPQLRDFAIFDRNGAQIFHSNFLPAPQINIADRPYFKALQAGAPQATFGPYIGRNTGTFTFALVRRLRDRQGGFAGVLFAAIEPEYYRSVCQQLRPEPGILGMLVSKTNLIISDCADSARIGQPLGQADDPHALEISDRDGKLPGFEALDGASTLIYRRSLSNYPDITVVVTADPAGLLASWRYHHVRYALVTGVSLAALLGLIVFTLATIQRISRHERSLVEAKEQASLASLYSRGLIEASLDPMVTISPEGKITDVNRATEEATGMPRQALVDSDFASYFTEPSAAQAVYRRVLAQGSATDYALTLRHRSGRTTDVLYNATVYRNERGEIVGIFATARDITERKVWESALRDSESRYRELVETQREIVMRCDVTGRITFINDAGCRVFNRARGSLVGTVWHAMIHPDDLSKTTAAESIAFRPPVYRAEVENRIRTRDGERWYGWEGHATLDGQGKLVGLQVVGRDITDRRRAEEQVRFLAHHDALTGLPNRLVVTDRFEQAMAYSARNHTRVAMLYLDLDNFKTINDSLGHSVGDTLLRLVALRLQECVRATDTVSRQGGDEFLIVLPDLQDTDDITMVSAKILERLAHPFEIDGRELSTSVSLGVAVCPDDGCDFDTLCRKADTAMYHAKEAGRNTCRFFDHQMNIDTEERLHLRNDLRLALERGEFVLYYQPQIDLTHGGIVGAEALIRWKHPELGLVLPGRFIPLAEESGLIVPIGEWVLHEACRQAVAWQQAGLPALVLAANLSAVQFKRGSITETVVAALSGSGLDPGFLELELTESILIGDTENVLATIRHLKGFGIRLSIDDFGTGYSSLAYLKRFAVDKLKIDQSFIRGLGSDPNDAAIVHAIIQMAHSLGLKTLAEGVEEDYQLELLRVFHCNEAQGYHIGRPMPADAFAEVLAEQQKQKQNRLQHQQHPNGQASGPDGPRSGSGRPPAQAPA